MSLEPRLADVTTKNFRHTACHDGEMEKQRRAIKTLTVLLVVSSAVLLSACTQQAGDDVTAFGRAQASTDQLPAGLDAKQDLGVEPASTRLLSDQPGVRYFAARSTSGKEVCLIMFSSPTAWTSACSTGLPIELKLAGVGEAQLISASGLPSSDKWTQVADNLAIRK